LQEAEERRRAEEIARKEAERLLAEEKARVAELARQEAERKEAAMRAEIMAAREE